MTTPRPRYPSRFPAQAHYKWREDDLDLCGSVSQHDYFCELEPGHYPDIDHEAEHRDYTLTWKDRT